MLRLTAFILNIPKRMLRGGAHDESASENGSDRTKKCDMRQKHSDFPRKKKKTILRLNLNHG
jgi:hypothetical protein